MRGVDGLAEHLVAKHDFGIGTQDHHTSDTGKFEQTRTGFFTRDAADVILGRLTRRTHFGHIDLDRTKTHAHLFQQLAAAR